MDTAYGGEVADVSKADYDQRTPLHIAASEGNVEIVEYLLKSGASVHVRDRNDTTPLQDAIREGHLDVIDILIRYQYQTNQLKSILLLNVCQFFFEALKYGIEFGQRS